MRSKNFEVLWYTDPDCGNYKSESFYTEKSAMKFYNEHKNDTDKFSFWVTHRNKDGEVIRDIVI